MIAYLRVHADRTGTPYDVRGWGHGMDAYLECAANCAGIPYPRDPLADREYTPVVAGPIGHQLVVHRGLSSLRWRRAAVANAWMALRTKCTLGIRAMRKLRRSGQQPARVDAVSLDELLEASRRDAERKDS